MLASMKAILGDTNRSNYGVMAMNGVNIEMARAGIMAAEEERPPIVIQFRPDQVKSHTHIEEMVPVVKELAGRAHVPMAMNLDHGTDFYITIDRINAGFTNMIFDGSPLPHEKSVERTAIISALAHGMRCSTEGELGHVGQAADADDTGLDLYTNPDQVLDFVERTGVDALAVAVGTVHGAYPKGKTPKLDFERLRQLKETLKMPLVLHDDSGSGEENLRKVVAGGISKINVCTGTFGTGRTTTLKLLEENPGADYLHMYMAAKAGIKKLVRDYMRAIGSNGRYTCGEEVAAGNE